jgi:hypothetical protein
MLAREHIFEPDLIYRSKGEAPDSPNALTQRIRLGGPEEATRDVEKGIQLVRIRRRTWALDGHGCRRDLGGDKFSQMLGCKTEHWKLTLGEDIVEEACQGVTPT